MESTDPSILGERPEKIKEGPYHPPSQIRKKNSQHEGAGVQEEPLAGLHTPSSPDQDTTKIPKRLIGSSTNM